MSHVQPVHSPPPKENAASDVPYCIEYDDLYRRALVSNI
jgi:hypothetical protein